MTQQFDSAEVERSVPGATLRRVSLLVLLLCVVMLGALVVFLWVNRSTSPVEGSAEAGFARDMMVHHAQAVEMAQLEYDRTENDRLRIIALDIMLGQQAQIGQMQGWLRLWRLPIARGNMPTATESMQMAGMQMPGSGLMPGMATAEQIAVLRASSGIDADRQFIELMIPHHTAGIAMAQAVLERTTVPVVRELAQAIIATQQREIDELQQILAELGDS